MKYRKVFGNAKSFYRVYPSESPDWNNFRLLEDKKTIQVHHDYSRIKGNPGEKIFKNFVTDGIFYNTPQVKIYAEIMEGVIESVFQGQNAIIVAFGQTGSGKSLTIGGLQCFYQDRGLIPRTIESIFKMKEKLPKNLEMKIQISYIEILSSFQSRDLLRPYPAPIDRNNFHKYLHKVEVRSDLHTLQHVFIAEGRKEYTLDTNHPSHAGSTILTFEFTMRNMNFSEPYEFTSKLHIIDLAGNDNSSTFKNNLQIGTANCIKSYLEHFILLLSGNDPELVRVKKRTNIISQYLGDTYNRSSILRFIGHLKTSKDDHKHSISMLKFGQSLKTMKPECSTIVLKENELMKLSIMEGKLNNLHKERLMLQMLQNQEPKGISTEIKGHIQRMVEDFVKNQIDERHLLKMGDIFTILKIMRKNILACEEVNAMLNKSNKTEVPENIEANIEKSYIHNVESSEASKSKQVQKLSDVGPVQSNSSQPINVTYNESLRSGNLKKTPSQSHKKESMDLDRNKSINKKGILSNGSVNGPKKSITLNKKKTGDSSASTEKTSKKAAIETQQNSSSATLILPDIIPKHKDALKEYANNPKTNYKSFMESFRNYESDAKMTYQNYLKELEKLDAYFDILNLRKNEVVQTKLMTQFSRKEETDTDAKIMKSQLEEKCQDNLKKAENDVATQQEVVLNLQAEFKIALGMRQQLKNEFKEEFEDFCREKYNIPIQNLEDVNEPVIENMTTIEEICRHESVDSPSEELNQENVYEEIYSNLKNLMLNEARKKSRYLKKSIKWLENTRSNANS